MKMKKVKINKMINQMKMKKNRIQMKIWKKYFNKQNKVQIIRIWINQNKI